MHICIYNIYSIYLTIIIETSQFFSVLRKRPWSARWERASPHCAATTGNCLENSWRRRWPDDLLTVLLMVGSPRNRTAGLPWKKHWDFLAPFFLSWQMDVNGRYGGGSYVMHLPTQGMISPFIPISVTLNCTPKSASTWKGFRILFHKYLSWLAICNMCIYIYTYIVLVRRCSVDSKFLYP